MVLGKDIGKDFIGETGIRVWEIVTQAGERVNLWRLQPGMKNDSLRPIGQDPLWSGKRLSLLEKGYGIFKGKMLWFLLLFGLLISPAQAKADPERGRLLFKEKHCVLCHKIHLPGTVFKPACPGLKGVGERHSREWLRKWLADPAAVWATHDADVQDILDRYFEYRGTKPKPRESFMATVIGKRVKLTDEEIEALIAYLLTL